MADKLTIEITTAVSQALAGLNETARAISQLQAVTVKANAESAASAVQHESALKNVWTAYRTAPSAGAMMKDLGVIAQGVGTTMQTHLKNSVESAGASIKQHLVQGVQSAMTALNNLGTNAVSVGANLLKSFGPLIGIGAGIAVGVGIEQAIAKTLAWDQSIAILSQDLQFNTTAASTWAARAEMIGVTADQLQIAFTRFGVAIVSRSSEFTNMGIAVVDANGKLRSTVDILSDVQKWFEKYRGTVLATDEAQKLFGRGNQGMAVLLGMTADQMKALDAEANRLGLIIGSDQLNKWRAFDSEVKAAGMSIQGVELALGHGLMPIFAVLGSAIGDFISNHIKQLVAWLATATGWVVGFIEALTGQTFKFSEFAAAIGQISTQVAQLGTIQDISGGATKAAANAIRDATQAITDQIDALRQQNQLLQEQTDAEIAVLQAQGTKAAYENQQALAKQKLVADQKNIDKLKSDYSQYLLIGDLANAQSIYDQLTAAQQQMANDQQQLDTQTADHARSAAIDELRAKQKTNNDVTNDLITQLQNRAKAIQQADQATLTGAASTAGGFTATWDAAGKNFTAGLDKASADAGAKMGANVASAMGTIATLLSTEPGGKAARDKMWTQVGDAIGKALIIGVWNGLSDLAPHPGNDVFASLQNSIINLLSGKGITPFHAAGGLVAGPIGAPRIIMAHGGERVVSNSQQGMTGPASSGGDQRPIYVTNHIYGQSDPEATANVVMGKLRTAFGRV